MRFCHNIRTQKADRNPSPTLFNNEITLQKIITSGKLLKRSVNSLLQRNLNKSQLTRMDYSSTMVAPFLTTKSQSLEDTTNQMINISSTSFYVPINHISTFANCLLCLLDQSSQAHWNWNNATRSYEESICVWRFVLLRLSKSHVINVNALRNTQLKVPRIRFQTQVTHGDLTKGILTSSQDNNAEDMFGCLLLLSFKSSMSWMINLQIHVHEKLVFIQSILAVSYTHLTLPTIYSV